MSDRVPSRWSRGDKILVVAVVVMAAAIIATAVYVSRPSAAEQTPFPEFALKAGDYLNYTMSGKNATGDLSGSGQITILDINVTKSIGSFLSSRFNLTPSVIQTASSSWLVGPFATQWYGRDAIQTVFGEKYVDKFIRWDSNLLVIAFVGSDSGIGYRLVAVNSTLSLRLDLASTSVDNMTERDTNKVLIDRDVGVPEEGGANNTFQGGGSTSMLFNVTHPVQLDSNWTGNGSVYYLFSPSNITEMENGSSFAYVPPTATSANRSSMSRVLEPGIYFWVFDSERVTDPQTSYGYNFHYLLPVLTPLWP